MATAPSPNELTRQQLDELDALLQRMLALPLNPPETPVPLAKSPEPPPTLPNVAPNWRVDPPATPAPHLLLAANALPLPDPIPEPAPAPEPERVAERATRQEGLGEPVGGSPKLNRIAAKREPEPAPPPQPEPEPAPEPIRVVAPRSADLPPPRPDLPPLPPSADAVTVAPPTPWHLAPLVAVNRLTDAVLAVFGPLGAVARSGFGRNVFGLAGLLLLAYTAARVAQVSGLLALPFALPWPQ